MKDNFPACLALTLKFEGGYVNNPRDPGGPTNLGIAIATLSHEMGRAATISDVQNLSRTPEGRALVESIYRKKFWNLIGGDGLPNGVDAMLFDVAVNSGPGRALQWTMPGLTTLARIKAIDARRCGFWRALRTFPVFGKGWMARENTLLSAALKMAGA
jgi:lysozyme family protein